MSLKEHYDSENWNDDQEKIQSLQQQCDALAEGIQLGMEMINEQYIRDSNIRPVTALNHFSTLIANYRGERDE